jgi:hypothetical protein
MRIELTIEQLQVIGSCLEHGPYKLVAPVLMELQRQISEAHQAEAMKGNGADRDIHAPAG